MKNDRRFTILFFVLSFAISWVLWSPFYFSENVSEFWVLPGAWGPTLSAIILAFREGGRSGIKQLLRKLLIWKVSIRYYLFAILGLICIALVAVAVHVLSGGKIPDISLILQGMGLSGDDAMLGIMLLPIFFLVNMLLGGPVAEELGWRGFAQPELQESYGPVRAGIVIGFLWSMWHLPLVIFLPKAIGGMPVVAYIPLMTAMGIVFSWLYNHTKGSVLLAIFLHGGMNFTVGFLGGSVFTDRKLLGIYVILVILLAIILARSLHKRRGKQVTNSTDLPAL
ncbi:MAG TPA: type II CAAX endopeptidase family protein [Eudoraea sp.]|nr:type II CAAX endopeptidase family protein [Eudoraea sp.]